MISSDLLYLQVPSHKNKIRKISISPVVPTGTLVSVNKYNLCSTYEYSHICKISISPVIPTGTLVSVNKYKFCSTYEYSRIRKISISPVVPTSTSV